ICENCKQFYDPPAELLRSLQIPEDAKFARGAGCDRCLNSGYKGRVALYELLHLSDAMRDKIIEGISTTQLKRMAIQEGMITLRRAGLQKVAQGVTTIDEVLSVTAPDER
ncbi:MAG: type II secretion system protein GspE, partial [Candidatus Hydrogenedentota bacterium]